MDLCCKLSFSGELIYLFPFGRLPSPAIIQQTQADFSSFYTYLLADFVLAAGQTEWIKDKKQKHDW